MGRTRLPLLVASALACALSACGADDLSALQGLPVRATPQIEVPHSEAAPGAPLRGTAVAVETGGLQ